MRNPDDYADDPIPTEPDGDDREADARVRPEIEDEEPEATEDEEE